jgi:hypothetical protein
VWYAHYCQTNWVKTILDRQPKSTIDEYVFIPAGEGRQSVYTHPQVDTAPSAFSLQVYAPGATPVNWYVHVYQNKFPVGVSLGGCDDKSCYHTEGRS